MSLETNKKSYSIYCLIAPNGKKYFGCSACNDINRKRWRYGQGYHLNPHLQTDIIKYGWKNFDKKIIKSGLDKVSAQNLERELIFKYRSDNPLFGYNKACRTVTIPIERDIDNTDIKIFACYIEFFLHLLDSHQKSYKTNVNGHRSYKK